MQNRPEGCIFFSPTKPKVSKICNCQVEGSIQPVSLPVRRFGASSRDFHKAYANSHVPVEKAVRLVICLDDILVMASSKEELSLASDTMIYFLQNLGFLVNVITSVLQPCQTLQFLGMEISSVDMTLNLPIKKIDKRDEREDHATVPGSFREVSSFHKGTEPVNWFLVSTAIVVLPAPLLYWAMQRQQIIYTWGQLGIKVHK